MNDALTVVSKNHDQAGLASRFRTEQSKTATVDIFDAPDLTLDRFRSDYVVRLCLGDKRRDDVGGDCLQDRNLPVVVRGALTNAWKCIEAWNVEYLKDLVGHAELPVRTNPMPDGTFGEVDRLDNDQIALYDFQVLRFHDFLDQLDSASPLYYPARVELCQELPELVPDVPSFYDLCWRIAFGRPYKSGTIAYFGPGGQTTPLHYDTLENLTFMIEGNKTFKMYPPSTSHLLLPAPRSIGTHYSLLSPESAEATGTGCRVTLHKGDMLYLPNCWWHSVHGGDGFNISLNYWFCQHPKKEDHSVYASYLQSTFEKTLMQLQSMQLPQSVLDEAQRDAISMIEQKIDHRKQFDWDTSSA